MQNFGRVTRHVNKAYNIDPSVSYVYNDHDRAWDDLDCDSFECRAIASLDRAAGEARARSPSIQADSSMPEGGGSGGTKGIPGGGAPLEKKSAAIRGAPFGNKNALGSKGGGAPLGNTNALGSKGGVGNKNAEGRGAPPGSQGGGAPLGNKNAAGRGAPSGNKNAAKKSRAL